MSNFSATQAESVRSLFGAIRTSAQTISGENLEQLHQLLPPNTKTFLDRIVDGTATPLNGTAESVMTLLCVLQIPIENAVPLWPPPSYKEHIGEALASAETCGACSSEQVDDFFLRIRAIKSIFLPPASVAT